jgi:phosphoribosylglycinamide formyltransferase 2
LVERRIWQAGLVTEETQTPEAAPSSEAQPTPEAPLTVMLLGAGELSRELVIAFQRLGAVVIAVDRNADAPALAVADRSSVVKMANPDELTALIERE